MFNISAKDVTVEAYREAIAKAANLWSAFDPQGAYELQQLSAQANTLAECLKVYDALSVLINFGTAGVRAPMAPGPNRMNSATVAIVATSVASYLKSAHTTNAGVVVGYDARLNSETYAKVVVNSLAQAGLKVFLFNTPCPTPLLAFAVKDMGLDAGIMVTASHNPKTDNGLKVYMSDGRQIVSPTDTLIYGFMQDTYASGKPLRLESTIPVNVVMLDISTAQKYINRVLFRPSRVPVIPPDNLLKVAWTPLHGVGGDVLEEILDSLPYARHYCVLSQREPDGNFPSTPFPNPELEEATSELSILAKDICADVAVCLDPDADRLCVLVKPETPGSLYVKLSGDTVGALIFWYMHMCGYITPGQTVASSIVSSRLLGEMAKRYGYTHCSTLTGFKHLTRVQDVVYAYEQACGYCVDPIAVSDKDGMSACFMFLELCAYLKSVDKSIWDLSRELDSIFGSYRQQQLSLPIGSLTDISALLAAFNVLSIPSMRVIDYQPPTAPQVAVASLEFLEVPTGNKVYITCRPSGTEPIVKVYIEVSGKDSTLVDSALSIVSSALESFLLQYS